MRHRDQHNLKAHHPAEGRHALVHITRSGEITLLYQNEGWQSTSVSLEPVRSSNEVISHADIGEDGADLLAITYDHSSRFRLYRISISWNQSQQSRGNQSTTLVAPTLEVQHLTCLHNVQPQHADSAKLTHLRLIPTVVEAAQTIPTQPIVVAIFTHASLPNDATNNAPSFSAIARWRIETLNPTLHEAFTKLNHKPGGNSTAVLNAVTVLRRQPDVVTNKVVLSFQSQAFDTIFAFCASDGSMEFRDRSSMDVLHSFGDPNTVSSMPQTGFEHLAGEHNMHVTPSADGSCLAVVRPDGKMAGHSMIFTHGWQALDEANKPFIEAGAVCVARQFAFLCYINTTNDETLSLLPPDATPDLRSAVSRALFRIIRSTPDISLHEAQKQQFLVLRDPMIPRAIAAQLAMGTDPVTGERDSRAQFAFVLLNLRLAGTSFAQALSVKDHRVLPPEIINTLRGLVRWATDLMIYIANTLTCVRRDLKEGTSAREAFEQLAAKTGNAAIYLLMSGFTRALLRFTIQLMNKYYMLLGQVALPRARSFEERQEMQDSLDMNKKIPFKMPDFEKLLIEFDQSMRDIFTKGGVSNERRTAIEISAITDEKIPEELDPAINAMMNTILPKLIQGADVSSMYFWETEWLGLASSKAARAHDVIRKLPLPPGVPLRWCRRCGSVAEELPVQKLREMPQWLHHAFRHCVCLDYWLLE